MCLLCCLWRKICILLIKINTNHDDVNENCGYYEAQRQFCLLGVGSHAVDWLQLWGSQDWPWGQLKPRAASPFYYLFLHESIRLTDGHTGIVRKVACNSSLAQPWPDINLTIQEHVKVCWVLHFNSPKPRDEVVMQRLGLHSQLFVTSPTPQHLYISEWRKWSSEYPPYGGTYEINDRR